jgi:hypothetical protein
MKQELHPIRLACTGNPSGPGLYHLLEVMGKEKVMGRIDDVIDAQIYFMNPNELTHEERFRRWIERPFSFLEHGRRKEDPEWNGAYVALSIGFFLCERYYRIKTATTESLSKVEIRVHILK